MKMKKFVLAASSLLVISGLAGCGQPGTDLVDEDYELAEPGTLAAGYTSLANQNANGPVDADGNYTAGGIKFKVKDTLKTTYTTEPTKDLFNYLTNIWTYNSYHYCNMVDGLVENDKYGNIVGALALGFKTTNNQDGTQTWSFQIRENAEWVNNRTGKKVADVTAEDFVSAAKYVLNPGNAAGASNHYTDNIVGAKEYYAAKATPSTEDDLDFNTVGVKAVSKYVIEYTCKVATPYFPTVLTYSPYLPVLGSFVEEEGTQFGKTVNDILVNGAFRITKHIPENNITYAKNYHYYDRDHVYLKHVERKFYPNGSTPDTTRKWFESGVIDSFTVSAKDATGYSNYVKGPDNSGSLKNPYDPNCNSVQSYYSSTFIGYYNFNRQNYEFGDGAHVTTDKERKDTSLALFNKHFRQGFLYGLKVEEYTKQVDPNEPYNYIMRGYSSKEMVSAGGKDFTDYVNDVYNREQETTGVSLIGIDNGSDPVYSSSKANAAFAQAKAELGNSVSYPIYIDMLGDMEVEAHAFELNMGNALEQASIVDGVQMIEINWNIPRSSSENTSWGSEIANYDFSLWSGWGPDYADPKTFAATWKIYGDMTENVGFPTTEEELPDIVLGANVPQKYQDLVEGEGDNKDYSKAVLAMMDDVLGEYDALYQIANAITDGDKLVQRFQAFAEAEYNLIFESAIIVPWYTRNGYSATVAKTIPWQAGRASYGLTSDKFKNVIAITQSINKQQRQAVTDEYNAGK